MLADTLVRNLWLYFYLRVILRIGMPRQSVLVYYYILVKQIKENHYGSFINTVFKCPEPGF
jgi:hypothetical protein